MIRFYSLKIFVSNFYLYWLQINDLKTQGGSGCHCQISNFMSVNNQQQIFINPKLKVRLTAEPKPIQSGEVSGHLAN